MIGSCSDCPTDSHSDSPPVVLFPCEADSGSAESGFSSTPSSIATVPKSSNSTSEISEEDEVEEPAAEAFDVVILGAGVSGLAAAQLLRKAGLTCVVLEARDRVGGRIHTVKLPANPEHQLPEVAVDLGANYLHGCSNSQLEQPLFHLARHLGVQTCVAPADLGDKYRGWESAEVAIWRDLTTGAEIPLEAVADVCFLFDQCLMRCLAGVQDLRHQDPEWVSLRSVFRASTRAILRMHWRRGRRASPALGPLEQGIFSSLCARLIAYVNPFRRLPATEVNMVGYEAYLAQAYHTDPDYPPAGERDRFVQYLRRKLEAARAPEIHVAVRPVQRHEDRLVVSGFSAITGFLAEGLDVRLGCPVREVHWSGGGGESRPGVEVRCSAGRVFRARRCLVTLPVGVLKGLHADSGVAFVPRLPRAKADAIDRLGIPKVGADTHNKVVLRFARPFWDLDAPHIECPDPRVHLLNLHLYGKAGVLMAHLFGGCGMATSTMTDDQVVAVIVDALHRMYPDTALGQQPIYSLVTRWSEDPWTLGSYTSGEVGSSEADRVAYASPLPQLPAEPRLLFAGEATVPLSEAYQCTHGAFWSGVRRASDILRLVGRADFIPPDKRIVDYLVGRIRPEAPSHPMKRRRHAGGVSCGGGPPLWTTTATAAVQRPVSKKTKVDDKAEAAADVASS